ncbi:centrosomin isoform X2 [Aedes aegypti]|uniref:Centrosomin N-terminal motif 1 domain-containing protein n=1 Tax=Aedes aegypti TaxID=7159 RepID=A0A6I8TYR9_AEDAE|nr:centrosomin isoform X2 [Aedes aegypti]XP_021706310.1 centrosomin isoform X2 [Aedes aegypti]XP_021706311.1 centrosomin isoform X2 [Aedes aegypti]XP_021706312.1 centrosomin isoform X2 [Aedes aegypti]XP_021706313.1 centrosomin isoform X2 [Aedes aegypti]
MSGIFKYTPNRAAASTPNRRSAFGLGFGGSPGQQDATMDNSYTMGFRSPSMNALAGQSSPCQGRSLREYEEQMSALRKENFNLKLRIYFLEENAGIGGNTSGGGPGGNGAGLGHGSPTDGTVAPESLFKQNIDLKVEVESLRKDLQEKQDLLCQAAKAMEMMEESQRKAEHHHREVLNDMEHRLEMLQQEIKQMEAADRQHQQQEQHHGNNTTRSALNDTNLLDILEKQHLELNVVDKLQALDMENVIRQCRTQNEELWRQISDLNKQLEEKEHKLNTLEVQLSEMRYECAEMKDKLEENDRSTSDAEVLRLKKDLFQAKSELAEKLCQLDDTEVKLKEKMAELSKTAKMVEKLVKTITELQMENARLKRNSSPELKPPDPVKKIVSDPGSAQLEQPIFDHNQQIVSQEEYDSLCQRLKDLQTKNNSLIQQLTSSSNDRNENIIIKQLNEEVIQAREEAEKAQRWRKECVDLCAISTARLEELAGFLDSLLRNDEFSGTLSIARRKAIRKAVDRSLDLSRSLNMSISVTRFSLPENSFVNLSSLTGFLNGTEQSLLLEEEANKENIGSAEKVIATLKAENRELRGQLENRGSAKKNHSEARRKLIPLMPEPVSDSEAWSEPDRDVSLARIGLEERSSLTNSGGKGKPIPRAHGTVLQEFSSTSENEGNVNHLKKQGAEVKQLQEAVQEKDSKILEIQTRMVDLDNKLQEERMKASRTQVELENTRHVNQRLEKEKNEQTKRLEELNREIQQKDELIEKLKKDRDQAFVDLRVALMKHDSLKAEYQDCQQKHKIQIDSLLAQERQRLEELRQDLTESFNNQLKAKQASFDASLEERYISKNIYLEKVKELEEVHIRLEDAHLNLMNMTEIEGKMKQQVTEAEQSVQKMRKALDDATLQTSKAALERTKAMNEKRLLEDELQHVKQDLEAVKAEKNELNARLVEVQTRLQQVQRSPAQRLNSSSGAECSTASGYASEEFLSVANRHPKLEHGLRVENSSPDLGIESDAGRLSNPETNPRTSAATGSEGAMSPARPLLKTLELTKSMSNLLMDPKEDAKTELNSSAQAADGKSAIHDCVKIEADFAELKRRYKQTRRHLELAYDSIKSSNKRKEQLERDIKQQIQKTNVVLKTVRTNMTNELEKSASGGALPQAETGRKS